MPLSGVSLSADDKAVDASTSARFPGLHPGFPAQCWVVVEQPRGEPHRIRWEPSCGQFVRTALRALGHARGFTGVYGWIAGTGVPPDPHHDVMVLTEASPQPGDILEATICGMFRRGDGDHKFVAVTSEMLAEMASADLHDLPAGKLAEVLRTYPEVGPGEGWDGARDARVHLATRAPTHD